MSKILSVSNVVAIVAIALLSANCSKAPRAPSDAPAHADDLPEGTARAVRITRADELLSGPMAKGRVGDLRIWNSKVSFIIGAAGPADGYGPYGGKVIAADRTRRSGDPGASVWGEVLNAFDLRTLRAEIVDVVADGRDGRAAVVRASGPDSVVPVIEDLISRGTPTQPLGLEIVSEFTLEPDAEHLTIRTTYRNLTPQPKSVVLNLSLYIFGDGAMPFSQGPGFAPPYRGLSSPFFAAVAPSVSYGLFTRDALAFVFDYNTLRFFSHPSFTVPAGGTFEETRYVAVGTGDAESIARIYARVIGEGPVSTVRGTVIDTSGKPIAGASVHVVLGVVTASDEGYVTHARCDANGAFVVKVPAGAYDLYATTPGRPPSSKVAVTVSAAITDSTAELTLPAIGTARVRILDERSRESIPAKLVVRRADDAPVPRVDKRFGLSNFAESVVLVDFVPPGGAAIELPPGRYKATLSRGFEYTIAQPVFEIRAATETIVEERIERVVDTTGYLSGDFHVHAKFSPDSSDTLEHKVLAAAAEGLEIPVSTEHEYIVDFKPAIAATRLEKWVNSIVGEEVTTGSYGHFNAFPLVPNPSAPNNGAIDWYFQTPPSLFDRVRRAFPSAVWQLNHPRSPGIGGYFSAVGYDPRTGAASNAAWWSENFNAIEVINGPSGYGEFKRSTFADWTSFLNRGKHVTGTGNSDSHAALTQQVGYPRNYVAASSDDPARLDEAEFIANVIAGKVIVSGGPFVTAAIETAALGALHRPASSGGSVSLRVKVQAPPWMSVTKLAVIVNGTIWHERTLNAAAPGANTRSVRFDGAIDLTFARDSWVIVQVEGDGTLGDVVPGATPFAVTNPIYVDVDRNGRFDPPGL